MTTISAVVFLYSPEDHARVDRDPQLDEAGEIGSAAAMATLIVATSAVVTGLLFAVEWWLIAAHAGLAQARARHLTKETP